MLKEEQHRSAQATRWIRKASALFVGVIILLSGACVLPSAESTGTQETPIVNLYDKSRAFPGFIHWNNVPEPSPVHYSSEHIPVQKGDVITFGPCNPEQDFHLHGFDSDQNISDVTVRMDRLTKDGMFGDRYCILSYTVPDNVVTVRVENAAPFNDVFMITKNRKFTPEEWAAYWNLKGNSELSTRFGTNFGVRSEGSLVGKSALFVGDSISCGSQEYGVFYRAWAGRIGTVNQMDYINASVSGASCSTTRSDNRIITQLKQNSNRNFDYVILHGGVNDAWDSCRVGKPTRDFRPAFDTTTFAGGLEEMIHYTVTHFPDARIGYIINFKAPNCGQGRIAHMDEYVMVAKQICEKWGIPYLNLYENDDFCNNVLKVRTNENLPDAIHPNTHGYDLLYPVIEEWMEELEPYQAPEEKPTETKLEETKPTETKPAEQPSAPIETGSGEPGTSGDSQSGSNAGCRSSLLRDGMLPVFALLIAAVAGMFRKRKRHCAG